MQLIYLVASSVVSILWAFRLPYEWGSDFGGYYAGAMFTDDAYRLYSQYFDHKGPIYYVFLKIIGWFIGFGAPQALFSLALTAFTFFVSLVILVEKKKKSLATLVLVIATISLAQQPTNASIALFLASQILFAYYFTNKYIATSSLVDAAFAGFFATSAVMTRIDAIGYLIWVVGALLVLPNMTREQGSNAVTKFRPLAVAVAAGAVLFVLVVLQMGLSINEMFVANISFNNYYKNVVGGCFYCRSNHFLILLKSGALFVIGYLLIETFKDFRNWIFSKKLLKTLDVVSAQRFYDNGASWTFVFVGVALWIYSGSDKDYHIYLILLSIFVLVIKYGDKLLNGRVLLAVCFSALPFTQEYAKTVWQLVRYPECLSQPFCLKSPALAYKDAVQLMKDGKFLVIIGGRGWPYVFARQKPIVSLNDWWLYSNNTPFATPELQKQFEEVVNMKEDSEILIDKSLYNSDTGSPYLDKIREVYSVKNNLDYYLVLKKH